MRAWLSPDNTAARCIPQSRGLSPSPNFSEDAGPDGLHISSTTGPAAHAVLAEEVEDFYY